MIPIQIALLLCAALVTLAVGWVIAERKAALHWQIVQQIVRADCETAERAEIACEELRKQVMRGACIVKVPRHSSNAQADLLIEVVAIEGAYHAFTNSPLTRARELYDRLVSTQQIRPLPPIDS